MIPKFKSTLIALATLSLSSCGADFSELRQNIEEDEVTSEQAALAGDDEITTDLKLTSLVIANQYNVIMSSFLFSSPTGKQFAYRKSLRHGQGFKSFKKLGHSYERNCDASDGIVTVSVTHDADSTKARRGYFRDQGKMRKLSRVATRTWEKEGVALNCNTEKNVVDLEVENLAGTTVKTESELSYSVIAGSRANPFRTQETSIPSRARSLDAKLSSNSSTTWTKSEINEDTLNLEYAVTAELERNTEAQNSKGELRSVRSKTWIDAEDPLEISSTRKGEDFSELVSRETSGTIHSVIGESIEKTLKLENLSFDANAKCLHKSGTISGEIKRDGEVRQSFEISSDGNVATIKFLSGEEYSFEPNCSIASSVEELADI